MDASVLESRKKSISGQFMACGNELNSNSDTTVYSGKNTRYVARFFYNSAVRPRDIDNLLAKKSKNALESSKIVVKTCAFGRGVNPSVKVNSKEVTDKKSGGHCKLSIPPVVQPQLSSHCPEREYANSVQCNVTHKAVKGQGRGLNTTNWQHTQVAPITGLGLNPVKVQQSVDSDLTEVKHINNHRCDTVPRDEHVNGRGGMSSHSHSNVCKNIPTMSMGLNPSTHIENVVPGSNLVNHDSANSQSNDVAVPGGFLPLYGVNSVGVEETFGNTIMHFKQFNEFQVPLGVDSPILKKWTEQSDFQFGFIPLGEQLIPDKFTCNTSFNKSLLDAHYVVRQTGKPNFWGARIPVTSQLNVDRWEELLKGYWDQQLLQLLKFGFPPDFNRSCTLHNEQGNHTSATQFPLDVDAYIEEECGYGALLGPFKEKTIVDCHTPPFMTRNKPNSDRCRVIIDLSWPIGASVNAGIDKDTYLNSLFALTFPTVDDITSQLKCLGRGTLLYKVDISRAFRHVRIDSGDFDLLGLHWRDAYIDMCLPFGMRHGSQIFQRLSDAVRYVMRQKGFCIIDYIDDYV